MSNINLTSTRKIQDKAETTERALDDGVSGWKELSVAAFDIGARSSSLPSKASAGMPSLRLDRVMAFVDANIALDLGVSRLAAVAGMSPYYFCRSFKQSTGITPHRYVLQRRMEQAKRLLEQKPAHLLEIARRTGFSDQSQFTRVFHKIVGMTPSKYRKELLALPKLP